VAPKSGVPRTHRRAAPPEHELQCDGKPIVHSLDGALGLFLTTGLDALVVEEYLIEK
jgi:hypothetical protein